MATSRTVNGHIKERERERRQKRMLGLLKAGKFPYTPTVMSWVSAELGVPASRLKPDHVSKLIQSLSAAGG